MKKHSRVIAFLMTVMLTLSLIPSTVFASEFITLDGELKIEGDAVEGTELSANYEKVLPDGITDDEVKFLWMKTTLEAEEEAELKEEENLERKEIGKEKTYTVTTEDIGYIIILQITGLEEKGYVGTLEAKTDEITEAVVEEVFEENIEEVPEEIIEENVEEVPEEIIEENVEETPEEAVPEDEFIEEVQNDEESWNEELFDVVISEEGNVENASAEVESVLENTEDALSTIEEIIVQEGNFDENANPVAETSTPVLTVNTTSIDFGELSEGYNLSNITAGTVEIKNNSESEIEIEIVIENQDGFVNDDYFTVTRSMVEGESEDVISTGATAIYSVFPKEGLTGKLDIHQIIKFGVKGTENKVEVQVSMTVEPIATPTPEATPEPTPEVTPEATPEPTPEATPEATPEPTPEVTPEPTPEVTPEPTPEATPEVTPEVTPEPTPEVTPEVTPEPTPEVTPEATPEPTEEPAEISISVDTSFYDFGSKVEGYENAPEAIKVTIKNTGDSEITLLQLVSDSFKIGELSSVVLQPNKKAAFGIRPKKGLVAGNYQETILIDTEEGVSEFLEVKFVVTEKEVIIKTASADNNKISGISSDAYTTQSTITFKAVGDGMDNTSPSKGDTRYCPANWSVFNVNTWKSSDYSASFGMGKAGTYNLTVTFAQQKFDGSNWVNTGAQDTKTVSFKVVQAAEEDTNKTEEVKTGDTTVILPLIIALLVALGCMIGILIYRKKR